MYEFFYYAQAGLFAPAKRFFKFDPYIFSGEKVLSKVINYSQSKWGKSTNIRSSSF